MFIKRYMILLVLSLPLFAGIKNLTLNQAIQILKNDNLELKISRFNEQMKAYEVKAVEGLNYGKLRSDNRQVCDLMMPEMFLVLNFRVEKLLLEILVQKSLCRTLMLVREAIPKPVRICIINAPSEH